MIFAQDLIKNFYYALNNGWGYIYGTAGIMWTSEKQKSTDNDMAKKYGEKWIGHHVADCSGLFVWAFRQLGGSIYHGSNTIWREYTTAKGKLTDGRRADGQEIKPGTAVFLTRGDDRHHIGLYVGYGKCIEAEGTPYGVVMSNLSHWDEWGELKNVDYSNSQSPNMLYKARVIAQTGSTVNMRNGPGLEYDLIEQIPIGSIVDVYEGDAEWHRIKHDGKFGYMMTEFMSPLPEYIHDDDDDGHIHPDYTPDVPTPDVPAQDNTIPTTDEYREALHRSNEALDRAADVLKMLMAQLEANKKLLGDAK